MELFHSPILTVSIPLPIPQILTLNDLIPIRLPQHVSWRARRFFPGLLRKQVRRVKRVIVPSEFTKQELVNWSKLSGERVIVIPHAVAETFHRPSQEEVSRVRQKFGLSDYLLALFSNRRHKNLMRLEQAYRSSNLTVPLVRAGAGRGTREEAEHGSPELSGWGRFLRQICQGFTREPACSFFRACTKGSGCRCWRPWPVAAVSPVQAILHSPRWRASRPAISILIPWLSCALCLETLLNDPQQLESLRKQGRARSLDFGWQESARATADLYRDVLSGESPGDP